MSSLPDINENFNHQDYPLFFQHYYTVFNQEHISRWSSRNKVDCSTVIKLASELPDGSFIAGGFMSSMIRSEQVNNFNIYFSGEDRFYSMIRRIHNAPEGAFLHGYESDVSIQELAQDSGALYINFTHSAKPTLQLMKLRWFGSAEVCLDKFDFRHCMFALGPNMQLTYEVQAASMSRTQRLQVMSMVFRTSSCLRIKRHLDNGWDWVANRYSDYDQREFLKTAKRFLVDKAAHEALHAGNGPINVGWSGEYICEY